MVAASLRENGHVTEVTLMVKSYVRGSEFGQFNGENGPVTEVASLMEGE